MEKKENYTNSGQVAAMGSNATATNTTQNQISNQQYGLSEEIVAKLLSLNIDKESIDELSEIIKEKNDPEKKEGFGKKALNWLGKITTKAVEKGVELKVPVILDILKDYM